MDTRTRKILRWTLAIIYIAIMVLYLVFDYEWARKPFFLMVTIIYFSSFFLNKKEND